MKSTEARPEVSVALCYRNAENTLDEAIGSILAQDSVDLELIAINDGSTDQGRDLVSGYASRDARVRLVDNPNPGLVRALNLGLQESKAPFIARMDADDRAHPSRLRKQLDSIACQPHVGALGTQVQAFPSSEVGEGLQWYVNWQNTLLRPDEHQRDLFVESPLCHPSTLLRRSAVEEIGGYREGDFPEDYEFFLRLDTAGYRFAKVPEVLLEWRHHGGRLTFTDRRYRPEAFRRLKARFLAPRLQSLGRPVTLWGAGPVGRRFARALEPYGIQAHRFIDIDPRKIGRTARGAAIVSPDSIQPKRESIVVAVGARHARARIRRDLIRRGLVELEDYVCVA